MEQKSRYLIIGFLGVLFLNILFLDWWMLGRQKGGVEKASLKVADESSQAGLPESEICPSVCLEKIKGELNEIIATLSGETKIVEKQIIEKVTQPTKVGSQVKVVYIPLGDGGATTSRDWTDIKTVEVYLDLNDYSGVKEVTWEAFLKVKHGNGRSFARLFDVTHSVFVPGSEISTVSENSTQERSSSLTIWSGNNLYRVQLKSLTGYEATIDSGRIKIVLE